MRIFRKNKKNPAKVWQKILETRLSIKIGKWTAFIVLNGQKRKKDVRK